MTLTAFLLARIAEDRSAAEAVTFAASEAREFDGPGWYGVDYNGQENSAHGRRWDPARVLAECEAKRRIVGSCSRVLGTSTGHERAVLALTVLRALALPYAAHPEYQEAWRP